MYLRKLVPLLFLALLAACSAASSSAPAAVPPTIQEPLVFYGWPGYMPQAILDAFTAKYGIPTRYMTYDDQEDALHQLGQGTNRYDVVVLGDTTLSPAIAARLLAELDYENIPNFRNLGANFRDLSYDPENRYSIMIQWGTTGLVARTDRLIQPVTAWADLWDPAYAGKIGVWPYADDLIGITLKSLGYSLNTQNPAELKAAEEKLLQLRRNVYLLDPAQPTGAGYLQDDHTAMIYGWSYDAMQAQAELPTTVYVLPQEGTILWSDSVTIPVQSRHKQEAELFINFLLEPEVSAKMVNELWIRSPNEAATPLIDPQILANPVVYPPGASLAQAEFFATVGPETRKRYEEIWLRFLTAEGPVSGAPLIP
jgi:spermidine/putrescine transport system substrate-binding protein